MATEEIWGEGGIMPRVLTQEEIRRRIRLFNLGLSTEQVARRVGIDPSAMRRWARRHGLQIPKKSNRFIFSKDDIACIAFGYKMAAIRGEIPAVLSIRRIMEWIDTRDWAKQFQEKHTTEQYWQWRNDVAEKIYDWLDRGNVENRRSN